MRRLFVLLFLVQFILISELYAQILAWDPASYTGTPESFDATTNDTRLNTSTLSRGAGISFSSLAEAFSSNDFTTGGTRIDAINNDDYLEFQISSQAGYGFSLSAIDANFRRSSTGPNTFVWRYSDDGVNFTDIGSEFQYTGTETNGLAQAQIDLTGINDLQNVDFGTTITIRLYCWGATATNGSFAIGKLSGNDLVIGGEIIVPEPTNHVTNFTATHNGATQVDLTWSDNDGAQAADGFLILANTTGTFADPVDGTPQADDTDLSDNAGQANVAHGDEAFSFTGLTPETQYFFKIYPYTNSGSSIDYKTDGTVPTANATPTTLLLVENFDYVAGTNLTDNGWSSHSGTGTNPITVNNGGLTFTDYPSSGIGNAALVDNNGEDVNRTFAEVTSGALYVSLLVDVVSISNDYFFHIATSGDGNWNGRIFINESSGSLQFGLSKYTETETYTSADYSTSTTYLLVLKYEIVDGADNDKVSLFVFDSEDDFSSEPGTPTIGPLSGSGDMVPAKVVLRQYSSAQNIIVDGIRVATSWGQAPLPVELTSFNAELIDNSVRLNWETATEVNNFGFDVERKYQVSSSEYQDWEKIGFVEGNGSTNSPREYSFTDDNLPDADNVSYRLKQIDIDGKYSYSKVVEVNLTEITGVEDDKQYTFALEQNYPNPFNPVTTISYTIPNVVDAKSASVTNTKLIVYNILGQQVQTLVNEIKPAGNYQVQFDGSNLPSGIYFYTLSYGEFLQTRKLVLLK